MPVPDPDRGLVDALDACLPQTQCTQCGFPCCRDYAKAIARGDAGINQCPPGGDYTIQRLAELSGSEIKPLNPANGVHRQRQVANIIEAECIGCTPCTRACPDDAISGAAKLMHAVVRAECSGCDLCAPACPVDCIRMRPVQRTIPDNLWPDYTLQEAAAYRRRHHQRRQRLEAKRGQRKSVVQNRRAEILAAVNRVRARREGSGRER